jgi:c-di-GMP-binding flagellar brake protein YcgR
MDEKKTEFKVKLGDLIQMQFIPEDGRERLNAKVIGHFANKSLIITGPKSNGSFPILRENQLFVIRMLQGNKVYGFESEVLKYYNTPYPHLHLSHPTNVECITVRSSRRVSSQHIVSIHLESAGEDDRPISGYMINTSVTGTLLQSEYELGELGDTLELSVELHVSNIQKFIRITGIIRNISTPQDRQEEYGEKADDENDTFRYGLEFVDVDEDDQLVLHGYVYEQIVKQIED